MREILGLFPAAGKAKRLGRRRGPSKEIVPVAAEGGERIACQDLLDSYRLAGAQRVLVLLRSGKWDVAKRLGDGSEFGLEIAYRVLEPTRGVPFTLARAEPFLGDRLSALGFPDVLVQPRDLLARLVRHRERTQAEVALALAPCDRPQASDLVDVDARGRVKRIEIKPESTALKWTWAFALWTPRFARFLGRWCETFKPRSARLGREPHVSDVLLAALADGIAIETLAAPEARLLDIGTPETLARAQLNRA
ncbi:MAG TPA: sugar phosphate nucleotidyltransferase [Thermoanaerobaculia bacterium]|nr:sugar phosphate nucleotidyltransferase [Thermoanaerobaculia bacterium]